MNLAPKGNAVLGIGGLLGHDSNAALIVDGRLIAASQEERHTRIKHDGSFPQRAIADCLRIGGIRHEDVTDVIFAEKPLQTHLFNLTGQPGNALTRLIGRLLPERIPGYYTNPTRQLFPRARLHFAWHHLSHVAGAFHSSPFDRAAFLCVDGKGEDYSASMGIIDRGELKLLKEQNYENGLGMFYTLVTHYLGFLSFGSEYKVMGLAPYGRPVYLEKLSHLYTTDERGGFRLVAPVRYHWESLMAALPLIAEATGVPIRVTQDELSEVHIDIATTLQQIFEDEVIKMARFVRAETGEANLLFCGGCAQNCVAAGQLRRAKIFDSVFNSPVGGDMGSGLGAAILVERERPRTARFALDHHGYYLGGEPGPAPADAQPWRVPLEGDLLGS